MTIIIVTGTPGTGKTRVATYLAKTFKGRYVYCGDLFTEESILSEDADGTKVIDTDIFARDAERFINKNKHTLLVIDGHLSHYIHSSYVDACIVTTCELSTLKKRLQERHYSTHKIRENLDSEILEICLTEAQELGHTTHTIDTTHSFTDTQHQLKALKISTHKKTP